MGTDLLCRDDQRIDAVHLDILLYVHGLDVDVSWVVCNCLAALVHIL